MSKLEKETNNAFAKVETLVNQFETAKQKALEIQVKANEELRDNLKETQREIYALKARQKYMKTHYADIITKCRKMGEFLGKLV